MGKNIYGLDFLNFRLNMSIKGKPFIGTQGSFFGYTKYRTYQI